MNNCIERKKDRVYNETLGEKIFAFACLIVAFFENSIVDIACRIIGASAVAVGMFFYISAVMAGSLGALETVFFGGIIIAFSAIVFKVKTAKS